MPSPKQKLIVELAPPAPKSQLGNLSDLFARDIVVLGHTCFGDLFIQDCDNLQLAIAYLSPFEVVPIDAKSIEDVYKLLAENPDANNELLRPADVDLLSSRLGVLGNGDIYIPVPLPMLGGDGSLESYEKGGLWAHIDLWNN